MKQSDRIAHLGMRVDELHDALLDVMVTLRTSRDAVAYLAVQEAALDRDKRYGWARELQNADAAINKAMRALAH